LLTWPATPARAFPYGIDDIINTINGTLSPAISSTNGFFQSIQSTEQSVIFPPGAIFQTQSNITMIVNGYRGWMSQVYTQPLSSAQLSSTSQLESLLHSGSSTTTPAIANLYQSTYGAGPISSAAAPPTIQQIVDMSDAHAISGLSLATATDQSASNLIAMANQIEDQSSSTAPGTADQLTAQAMALQLQSLAAQHQLLASQLRQEAGILAQQTSDMKRSATSTQSMNNVLQNLLNTTK
jgi:hypothetical protein